MSKLMSQIGRIRAAGIAWLVDSVPGHSMVLLRVALGGILFSAYLSRWNVVDIVYGPTGYAGAGYHERFPESGPVGWPLVQSFDQLQYVSSDGVIWFVYLGLLASSLCFALGIWARWTGFLALVFHSPLVGRNPAATWGWATMIKPFLLYTALSVRATHPSILSWMRRRAEGAGAAIDWTCSAWPLRLVQVHASVIFLALWQRVDEASWYSGQMLYVALMSRDWGRVDFDWTPFLGLMEVAGVAAMVLELSAPILLWFRPTRTYCALALIGMFGTLVLTTSVGWWDFMMLFVLATFLPSEWFSRGTDWVVARVARERGPTSESA